MATRYASVQHDNYTLQILSFFLSRMMLKILLRMMRVLEIFRADRRGRVALGALK